MPIYEYKCRKCGRQFEAFQGITEPELKTCKFCKGKVHKLVSLSSFSLKGSGWYVTDYAGKKPPVKTETTETKVEAKAAESSTASADTSATTSTTSKED
jgi:putative FmdB family regulatory protein